MVRTRFTPQEAKILRAIINGDFTPEEEVKFKYLQEKLREGTYRQDRPTDHKGGNAGPTDTATNHGTKEV